MINRHQRPQYIGFLILYDFAILGKMFPELHGKIFENESENFPKIPRVPNDRQWKCISNGPENRQIIETSKEANISGITTKYVL